MSKWKGNLLLFFIIFLQDQESQCKIKYVHIYIVYVFTLRQRSEAGQLGLELHTVAGQYAEGQVDRGINGSDQEGSTGLAGIAGDLFQHPFWALLLAAGYEGIWSGKAKD